MRTTIERKLVPGGSGAGLRAGLGGWRTAPREELRLIGGSRVAVIGGGPAGSMFGYFLLQMAERADLEVSVDIYEPRDFAAAGPKGCNMCGGGISEALVQALAAEGIVLPDSVVRRGLDSYLIHTPEATVRIDTPIGEARIAGVHRGGGPRGSHDGARGSFDGFLLDLAGQRGASVIRDRVTALARDDGMLQVTTKKGGPVGPYDLVAGAVGVNSRNEGLFEGVGIRYEAPRTTKAYVAELAVGREWIDRDIGSAMHIFLLDVPGIEFAALLPKGDYLTFCLVGPDIERPAVDAFLTSPSVAKWLPPDWAAPEGMCSCYPKLSLRGVPVPYADRLVLLGDCGITRYYKDGIGAAYRAAKAAAVTAVFSGVSDGHFAGHFMRTCRSIRRDNRYGKVVFWTSGLIQHLGPTRRGMVRMMTDEQAIGDGPKRMSSVMWDTFSGTALYGEVFARTLTPAFVARFLWSMLRGNAGETRTAGAGGG